MNYTHAYRENGQWYPVNVDRDGVARGLESAKGVDHAAAMKCGRVYTELTPAIKKAIWGTTNPSRAQLSVPYE
jgi:hypothetical protein